MMRIKRIINLNNDEKRSDILLNDDEVWENNALV